MSVAPWARLYRHGLQQVIPASDARVPKLDFNVLQHGKVLRQHGVMRERGQDMENVRRLGGEGVAVMGDGRSSRVASSSSVNPMQVC